MGSKPFHLGWFTNFAPPVWNGSWRGNEATSWTDGSFYVDMAKAMERACFDYIMLEDSEMVPDAFGNSMKYALKHAHQAPKLDPILLLARMSAATKNLGLIATASTSFWPPFLLARQMATVDHMSHGRAGWNIVTSSEDRAAQNFGLDKLYGHDERYERADEYTELMFRLWDSWEPDAVVADTETGTYVDADKVHVVDFKGKYYSSRGPLNTPPMPQGHPVICQAGSSPRGREFAAKYAETILAVPTGLEKMRAFRDDVRARMARYDRKPDECKILFICEPILGATEEEAWQRRAQMFEPTAENVERGLMGMSTVTDIDFSQFDVSKPLPRDLTTNGHQSSLANFYTYGETLADVAMTWLHHYADETLVGTPDQVAARMGEMMEYIGGDGFLISGEMSRQFISQVCDGLVPALQRRGLTRTAYTGATLREHLLEF
jgi:long-chain alkane monooxygenase